MELPDQEVVTPTELRAWYMYDWSNSAYAGVVIGVFLPILLQEMASQKAGYPEGCPNYYANDEVGRARSLEVLGYHSEDIFADPAATSGASGGSGVLDSVTDFFHDDAREIAECNEDILLVVQEDEEAPWCAYAPWANGPDAPSCTPEGFPDHCMRVPYAEANATCTGDPTPCSLFCREKPDTETKCLEANGADEFDLFVSFLGSKMRSSEYAYNFLAFSVIFQALAFTSIGAIGDYGPYRKKALMWFSVVGAVACILCITVTPDLYWLGGLFMIISNVCFGAGYVLYNAWLPLLARNSEEIAQMAEGDEKEALVDELIGTYSSTGFAYGYGATLILLILLAPFLVFSVFGEGAGGFRFAISVSGCWWLLFSTYTFKHLKERAGPELPDDATGGCCTAWDYVSFSWRETWRNGVDMKRNSPITFKYVLLWFLFSDGVGVIFTVGALIAYNNVDWCTMNAGAGVLALVLEIQLFAMLGNIIIDKIVRKYKFTHKNTLFVLLLSFLVVPIWGFAGWEYDGFKYGWEILILGPLVGFPLGAFQSYARALMAELTPKGYESQYMAFYEITDKGSGWMGPLVAAQIVKHMDGEIRWMFIYIFCMIFFPALLFMTVDIEKGKKTAYQISAEQPRRSSTTSAASRSSSSGSSHQPTSSTDAPLPGSPTVPISPTAPTTPKVSTLKVLTMV